MRKNRKKITDKYFLKRPIRLLVAIVIIFILVSAYILHHIEGRSFPNAVYFAVITMTTIGYGDIVPHSAGGKLIAIFFALSGVPIFIGIAGLIFESRIKNNIIKHMDQLERELSEAENKLEETEQKLLSEEKKLLQIEKQEIKEKKEKTISIFKKLFSHNK